MIFPEKTIDGIKYKGWKDSSMGRHDLYNFESKINYTLEKSKKKKTSYFLDTYFFIPEALQLNKETYSKERFFSDINTRIRFKTPKMTIDGILDDENELSPVNTIKTNLKYIEYGKTSRDIITSTHRELRLLSSIIKVSLRDQFTYFLTNYQSLKKQSNFQDLIKSYLKSIEMLQLKMSHLRDNFLMAQVPEKLKEAFQLASEYISFQLEFWIIRALKTFEKELNSETQSKMIKIIEYEQKNRKNIHSRLIIEENTDNESYSYWEGILKKYVQSVLYLDKKRKDPKSSSLEVFYSIAAAVAMFFSLFLGFLILSNLELYSIPFLIATVVIYMLKDRIKDNIRYVSQKAVGLFFPDRRIDIVDGFNQEKIGESKEKVNYINKEDIPPEILKIRRASNITQIEEKGKPEVIILYRKKITLFNNKIEEYHRRRRDISDVMRFNIRDFLRYADDPVQFELNWNKDKKVIESVPIAKVYHLNIIFQLTSYKKNKLKKVYYKKFRVILNQKGIKRVIELEISL